MATRKAAGPPQFASKTDVPVERTRMDIEKMLRSYGATGFVIGWHQQRQQIGFVIDGLQIRFTFDSPTAEDCCRRANGDRLPEYQHKGAIEQAERTLWRELHRMIQGKLIAAFSPYRTVYEEFHADIVLANGQTFSEWSKPLYRAMLERSGMPPLLPGLKREENDQ